MGSKLESSHKEKKIKDGIGPDDRSGISVEFTLLLPAISICIDRQCVQGCALFKAFVRYYSIVR